MSLDVTSYLLGKKNAGGGENNYSTEEQMIGTWIDKKPLYQKVVEIPARSYSANTLSQIPHNIANLDFGFVLTGGLYYDNSTYIMNSFNATSINSLNNLFYWTIMSIDQTNMELYNSKPFENTLIKGGFVIVRYTKTTD